MIKKESSERIKTGIQGFDELIEGGLPRNSLIMLSGTAGTGKTTFAMEFLIRGAEQGEPGVYIGLEELDAENLKQVQSFGWDLEGLQKNKKLLLDYPHLYDFERLTMHIEDSVSKIGAKRLVIDSISLIGLYFKDGFKVRRALLDLETLLKRMGCTTLVTCELSEDTKGISMYGVEEFLADGVIIMQLAKVGEAFKRGINIRKMRATDHSLKIHPLDIKKGKGIVVHHSKELN